MSVSYYLKTSRFDPSRTHYRHGMIQMLNVNTICKEGDIGLMIAITLNIRFKTSSTRTFGVCMLAPLVVWKERMQYHLHITRDNDTIDIESYGQLTLYPIASDIHKTIGLPHQLNVTIRYIFYTIWYSMPIRYSML